MSSESDSGTASSFGKLMRAFSAPEKAEIERKALRRLLTPSQFAECVEEFEHGKGSRLGASLSDISISRGYVTQEVLEAGMKAMERAPMPVPNRSNQTSVELQTIINGGGVREEETEEVVPTEDARVQPQSEVQERTELSGKKFGSFKLLERIGSGPLSDTYLAQKIGLNTAAAVKVYFVEKLGLIAPLGLVFDRMRTAGQIRHENLVHFLGCGRSADNKFFYCAMERLRGLNLGSVIKRRSPFDEKTALSIAISISKGLKHVHNKGIVHGNLKPSNIFLTEGGIIRVADTGLPRSSEYIVHEYLQGDLAGADPENVAFIPPELIDGQNLMPSADTYTLGLLLCFMLAGKLPFKGDAAEILKRISSQESPLAVLDKSQVSHETRMVIETMVSRVSGWRYEDMTELIGALRASFNALRDASTSGPAGKPDAEEKGLVIEKAPTDAPREDILSPSSVQIPLLDLATSAASEERSESSPEEPTQLAGLEPEDYLIGAPLEPVETNVTQAPETSDKKSESAPKQEEPAQNSSNGNNTALLAVLEQVANKDFGMQSGLTSQTISPAMRSSPNILAVTPEVLIGQKIGQWQLERIIGYGIIGDTYLAAKADTDEAAAVKVYLKQVTASETAKARFNSHCRLAMKLKHPNLLQGYDFGETENGHCYFAMEYMRGRSLKRLIRRNGFIPERMALGIALFLARGLQHAHERGIIHGNLKPSNVLIDREGRVKTTDCGLPRSSEMIVRESTTRKLPKELKPEAVTYIPAEIVIGASDLRPQTDVYGLGMLLYHMLTGRVPYKGTIHDILENVKRGITPRFVSSDYLVSRESKLLVTKMIKPRPADRVKNLELVAKYVQLILEKLRSGGSGKKSEKK